MEKGKKDDPATDAIQGLATGLRITAKGIGTESIGPIIVDLDRSIAQGQHSPPYQAGIEKVRDILKEELKARQGPTGVRTDVSPNPTPSDGGSPVHGE